MPKPPAKKMSERKIVAIIVVFVMATLSCVLLNYNYFFSSYKRCVSVLIAVIMILYQQTAIQDSCHRCVS